jgi:hypothetical protein
LESGEYRGGHFYTLEGTFTLMRPSGHTNYYGLVFGGSGLEGPQQSYLYFVVAQNGTRLIKRRDGDATSTVSPTTPNDAVKKPDASGKSTNALEVHVGAAAKAAWPFIFCSSTERSRRLPTGCHHADRARHLCARGIT